VTAALPFPPNRIPFAEAVARSRLLSRDAVAISEPAEDVAARLVGERRLTRFQAEKLLGGFWQGLVIGPYRLMCPLGRGGVGIVYLARDDRLPSGGPVPRLVALKVLSPKRAREEPRALVRFRRELDIGRQIPDHPHLTKTLDGGVADGVNFIAVEFAPGKTAKQVVADGGPMAVPAAVRVFADVARGLHAAHLAGFVHRDTKPSNIIVSPAGRGKLLDFGFALRRGERADADPTVLGGKGYTLGTLDYLPPEQATNAVAVGAETDVYSLGCSLYFALTGHLPHPGGTAKEKIRAHQTTPAVPIGSLNPQVPAGFAALVAWMMAKRPEDRPQSAGTVADELDRWAPPAVPTATRLSHDEAWEWETIDRIEAALAARRPAPPAAEVDSSRPAGDDSPPVAGNTQA
jgi:serine/threonine protein kinase